MKGQRLTMIPSDVRLANAARVTEALRNSQGMSRSDLAREVGMSVPAVHRLMSELVELNLVYEESPVSDGQSLGRPPAIYRFREDVAVLAGLDVGNETTRLLVTTLDYQELSSISMPTAKLGLDLTEGLAELISRALQSSGKRTQDLVGVGVGVAAAVDPQTGSLHSAPFLHQYEGVSLAKDLEEMLGCSAIVQQDDHFSARAEGSQFGTFPGTRSLLVLEIGFGIGVGMTIDGVPITGVRGRFGRVADWPVSDLDNPYCRGTTLGACITASGLVHQYRQRQGSALVDAGATLVQAARTGDPVAKAVVDWAANEIGEALVRLQLICDPECLVLGGGLSGAYDLMEPILLKRLGRRTAIAPSVLKDRAVAIGALLEASRFIEAWLQERLLRA